MLTACRLPAFPTAVEAGCAHLPSAVCCTVVGAGCQGDVRTSSSLQAGKLRADRSPWGSRAGFTSHHPQLGAGQPEATPVLGTKDGLRPGLRHQPACHARGQADLW